MHFSRLRKINSSKQSYTLIYNKFCLRSIRLYCKIIYFCLYFFASLLFWVTSSLRTTSSLSKSLLILLFRDSWVSSVVELAERCSFSSLYNYTLIKQPLDVSINLMAHYYWFNWKFSIQSECRKFNKPLIEHSASIHKRTGSWALTSFYIVYSVFPYYL